MNYKEAKEKLNSGRDKTSRKLENNTYLKARGEDIAVLLHSTDILLFRKDGSIVVRNGGFPTITTHDRLNTYLPKGFRVFGEPVETRRSARGMTVLRKYNPTKESPWSANPDRDVLVDGSATISPRGKMTGGNAKEYRAERKKERAEASRPINRGRYWMRKLDGIHYNREACTYGKNSWECNSRSAYRRRQALRDFNQTENTEMTLNCGCIIEYREPSAKGLTVSGILAETNTTVKAAQIKIYGTEKFFQDANPTIIESLDPGYQLLEIPLETLPGDGTFAPRRVEVLRALKMVCSSTGDTHIHAVPANEVRTVAQALDWIFDVKDYLGSIGEQS